MKLSRILSNQNGVSRRQARLLIASGRVTVNDVACGDPAAELDRFSSVKVDGEIVQKAEPGHYLMLHKPAGFLSATLDHTHTTVMELVAPELREDLHIAGRLDRASTGLLILTNDGRWYRQLHEPLLNNPKIHPGLTTNPHSHDPPTPTREETGMG